MGSVQEKVSRQMLCSRQPGCSLDRSFGWEQITDITDLHTRAWGTPTDGKANFVAVLSLLSQPRWSSTGKSLWEDSGLVWLQISCPTLASHRCFSHFLPLKRVKEEQRIFPVSLNMAFNYTPAAGTFLMLPTIRGLLQDKRSPGRCWESKGAGSSGNCLCNLS